MRIPMMLVCRTALIYCLAASLPVVAQSTQQKPSTRPAPAPRPSKPGGDVSIQPYPNPPKPGPTPRPPGQNPGQRPPGTNPGSNPGARPPSRPPSRPTGDVTIQPYPYPPKPGPRPPRPPTWAGRRSIVHRTNGVRATGIICTAITTAISDISIGPGVRYGSSADSSRGPTSDI